MIDARRHQHRIDHVDPGSRSTCRIRRGVHTVAITGTLAAAHARTTTGSAACTPEQPVAQLAPRRHATPAASRSLGARPALPDPPAALPRLRSRAPARRHRPRRRQRAELAPQPSVKPRPSCCLLQPPPELGQERAPSSSPSLASSGSPAPRRPARRPTDPNSRVQAPHSVRPYRRRADAAALDQRSLGPRQPPRPSPAAARAACAPPKYSCTARCSPRVSWVSRSPSAPAVPRSPARVHSDSVRDTCAIPAWSIAASIEPNSLRTVSSLTTALSVEGRTVVPRRASRGSARGSRPGVRARCSGRRSRRPGRGQRRSQLRMQRAAATNAAVPSSSPGSAGCEPELDLGHDRRPIPARHRLCRAGRSTPRPHAPAATRRRRPPPPTSALSVCIAPPPVEAPRHPAAKLVHHLAARPDGPRGALPQVRSPPRRRLCHRTRAAGSQRKAREVHPQLRSTRLSCVASSPATPTAVPCRQGAKPRDYSDGRAEAVASSLGRSLRHPAPATSRSTGRRSPPSGRIQLRSHIAAMFAGAGCARARRSGRLGLVQADDLDERHRRRVALAHPVLNCRV